MPVNRSPIFGCVRIFSIVCGGEFIFRKKWHAYSQNIRAVYIFKSIKLYQNYLLSATLRDKWQIEHTRKNTASNIHRPLRISCFSIYALSVSAASHKSGAGQSARSFSRAKKSKNIRTTLITALALYYRSQNIHTILLTFSGSLRRVLVYICVRPKERPKTKTHKQKHFIKKNIKS